MMSAISSKGTANMSCSTKASRSAGASVSSTTSRASPTESARSASSSGPAAPSRLTMGSGTSAPTGSSRRRPRERSWLRHTRPTTVVSQPPRFSTSLVSARLSLSQVSCTASSAAAADPSMRYATRHRWARCSSNWPANHSCSSMSRSSVARCHTSDHPGPADVTRRQVVVTRSGPPGAPAPGPNAQEQRNAGTKEDRRRRSNRPARPSPRGGAGRRRSRRRRHVAGHGRRHRDGRGARGRAARRRVHHRRRDRAIPRPAGGHRVLHERRPQPPRGRGAGQA